MASVMAAKQAKVRKYDSAKACYSSTNEVMDKRRAEGKIPPYAMYQKIKEPEPQPRFKGKTIREALVAKQIDESLAMATPKYVPWERTKIWG